MDHDDVIIKACDKNQMKKDVMKILDSSEIFSVN